MYKEVIASVLSEHETTQSVGASARRLPNVEPRAVECKHDGLRHG